MAKSTQEQNFNPLIFLKSLGLGGLSVSFFMYLMFMTKYETPIPTFDSLIPYFSGGSVFMQLLIIFSVLGITIFLFWHIISLFNNIKYFITFVKSGEYKKYSHNISAISLMAIPLTFGMTMNILFISSVIFIPGLWSYIEYIFPFAIGGFLAIGSYGLRIYGQYFSKRIQKGGLNEDTNNSLSQMLAVFALAMVGVGLAGPAAMSHTVATSVLAMFFSLLFLVSAGILLIIKLVIGFQAMFSKGINPAGSPSLWIMIPILTLFSISIVRHNSALAHNFHLPMEGMEMFIKTSIIIVIQLFFGYLGYLVMKQNHYFTEYLSGEKKDIGSYALICPGVALMVSGMFFLHKGIVFADILPKFSPLYFILLLPLVYVQIKTILTVLKIHNRMKRDSFVI